MRGHSGGLCDRRGHPTQALRPWQPTRHRHEPCEGGVVAETVCGTEGLNLMEDSGPGITHSRCLDLEERKADEQVCCTLEGQPRGDIGRVANMLDGHALTGRANWYGHDVEYSLRSRVSTGDLFRTG